MDDLFFVVSKIIWGLLSPSCLLMWLLILATVLLWLNYVSAAKKLLLLLSVVGFGIMAYPVGDNLMYPLESRFEKPATLPENIDGIVVLGGAEQLKLAKSWNTAAIGDSAERILTAAELARQYPTVPVIYSGGSNLLQMPDLDHEGLSSLQLLKQAGIGEQRIVMETHSRNTYENFKMIKPILPKPEGRYILVTSSFHMPRSVGIAREQDFDVIPYPVDFRSNQPENRYWDFDMFEHLDVLETAWHEWLGLTAYYVTGKTSAWLPAEKNRHQSTN